MSSDGPWFERAFGRDYLTVYARRSREAAREDVDRVGPTLELSPGCRVLDLACGAGRYAEAIAARGARVTGLDYSKELVSVAAREVPAARFVRGDMRTLPFDRPFDAVVMFFTSFGYFRTEEEDRRVLGEVARVLRPGGRFLLDYVSRDEVVRTLVPESDETVGGYRIRSRRWTTKDPLRVEKEVRLTRPDGTSDRYVESVRLYGPEEVLEMLSSAGFAETVVFDTEPVRFLVLGRLPC
jgi:SAM-dependent methyltransferase